MKKKYLFLSLIAAMVIALGAKAQEETYNMIIKMADGTTVFINPNDVDSISFNNGEVSVSGSNINELVETIKECRDRTTVLELYMNGVIDRLHTIESNVVKNDKEINALIQHLSDVNDRLCATENKVVENKTDIESMTEVIRQLVSKLKEMDDNAKNITGDTQIINPETGEPYTVVVTSGWSEYDEETDEWIEHEAITEPLTMGRMVANLQEMDDKVKYLNEMIERLHYPLADFLECSPWRTGEKLVEFLDDLKSRLDALEGGGDVDPAVKAGLCPDGNHPHMIDLGLPNGTKWACCNVGATKPWESGDYYAWGETEPKSEYNWSTYFDTDDGGNTFKKYNNNGGLTELLPEDDAATANWGSDWQMPSEDQCEELIYDEYTEKEYTTMNGVNGMKITSISNGNSIFLPATGLYSDDELSYTGSEGYYWSRSLTPPYRDSSSAYVLYFYLDDPYISWAPIGARESGNSVRPVRVQE